MLNFKVDCVNFDYLQWSSTLWCNFQLWEDVAVQISGMFSEYFC